MPPVIEPDNGAYLLNPGEYALFEWRAGKSLDEWVDTYNSYMKDESIESPRASIRCVPGSRDDLYTEVVLSLGGIPIAPTKGRDDRWRIEDSPWSYVNVSFRRSYPKNVNLVRQDLTGEFWDGIRFWKADS
jgi:hypothetical protein